jgi:ketosteroid isomerase-like protein
MSDVDEFVATAVKAAKDADAALHDGDPEPRIALWGRREPVTVFGAIGVIVSGWDECESLFRALAGRFSDGRRFDVEVVAVDVCGDMAYTAAIEDSVVSFDGSGPRHNRLRVTQIYRRENGEWKLVHRHGDHVAGFPRDLDPTEVPA